MLLSWQPIGMWINTAIIANVRLLHIFISPVNCELLSVLETRGKIIHLARKYATKSLFCLNHDDLFVFVKCLSFRYIHCAGQFTPKMKANAEPRLLSSLV